MPIEIITNAASTASSLALLVSPHPDAVSGPDKNAPAAAPPAHLLNTDWRNAMADHGYDFTVQYLCEGSANVSGGVKRGEVYNGLLNVGTMIDLEKAIGWKGGSFHATMLFPHGRSLTDNYVGDLYRLSNLDAADNVHLFELWLEQSFFGGKFSLRAGQMAVDQEFAYTEQGALFANSAFGWFPIVGAPAPVYPQGAPGVRLAWHPNEKFFWQAAVVDGNVNPSDPAGRETNPHGLRAKLDEGALILNEAGVNWSFSNDRKGSTKLGVWYHTDQFQSVRFDNTGLSLANPLSTGKPKTFSGDWGIYICGEQVLWRENPGDMNDGQNLGMFFRAGYEPDDRNLLQYYAEGGLTRTGLLPHRNDDVIGLGVAFGGIGGDTRGLVRDQNFFGGGHDPVPDHEMVIEFDYQAKLFRSMTLQPEAQYIIHPGGSTAVQDAFVLGLRAVVDF